jgi:hypothetical protein
MVLKWEEDPTMPNPYIIPVSCMFLFLIIHNIYLFLRLDKMLTDVSCELLDKEHADISLDGAAHPITVTAFLISALDIEQIQ